MVIVALLVAALVCLALGLTLGSSAWLIGSVAASIVAGFGVWRTRVRLSAEAEDARRSAEAEDARRSAEAEDARRSAEAEDARRSAGAEGAHRSAEPEDGRRTAPPDREADATPAAEELVKRSPAAVLAPTELVWVIDGRPRFHRRDCDILVDQDAEAIPFAHAIEDGFVACSLCEPGVTRAG
jgi:ABC-type nickel/cobalt efflux system permease component RcnA